MPSETRLSCVSVAKAGLEDSALGLVPGLAKLQVEPAFSWLVAVVESVGEN